MNSLYVFEIPKTCRAYVASANWKAARNEVLKNKEFMENMTKLPQIKGFRLLANCTDQTGCLSIKEIVDAKLAWWNCGGAGCENHDFVCIDGGQGYRCKACGYEGSIPGGRDYGADV